MQGLKNPHFFTHNRTLQFSWNTRPITSTAPVWDRTTLSNNSSSGNVGCFTTSLFSITTSFFNLPLAFQSQLPRYFSPWNMPQFKRDFRALCDDTNFTLRQQKIVASNLTCPRKYLNKTIFLTMVNFAHYLTNFSGFTRNAEAVCTMGQFLCNRVRFKNFHWNVIGKKILGAILLLQDSQRSSPYQRSFHLTHNLRQWEECWTCV